MTNKINLLYFLVLVSIHSFSQGVIVNSNPTFTDRFPKKSGNLRLSSTLLKFGNTWNNEVKSDTIRIFNEGTKVMNINPGKIPAHLHVTLGTDHLPAETESWLAVSYDGAKRNDYGFVLDRFDLHTSDAAQPKKWFSVSARLHESFPPMSAGDSASAVHAKWAETTFDYGTVQQSQKITHRFTFINEGKQALYIRKTKSGCSCLKTIAVTDTIAPGDTGSITLEFDTAGKTGKDSARMVVYLNDPFNPEVVLVMIGEIEK